jgi:allophanate hydrolase
VTARERVTAAYARIRQVDRPEVWIALRDEAAVLADADAVDRRVAAGEELPLAGRLLAVKDNVDVAGLPTTAGCRAFTRLPAATAPAVQRLVDAGAVVVGKTNLDQFATGLVGTRSPFGAVRNAFLPELVSGGSSSGSAVAVALCLADIGIATDTAGSGRVPAAFQGIIGFKPTPGIVPLDGVVPASRSFDVLSVLTRTLEEGETAIAIMAGSPSAWPADAPVGAQPRPVVAVPDAGDLPEMEPGEKEAFEAAAQSLAASGAEIVRVDPSPFLTASRLLYGSALRSERYAAVGSFIEAHPLDVDEVVAGIILASRAVPAHLMVQAQAQLAELALAAGRALAGADALLMPTVPGHPSVAEVAVDPIGVNDRLGRFCSFANLLRMPAVAVPEGHVGPRPYGITVFARPFADRIAADVARLIVREPVATITTGPSAQPLLVVGAHMSGLQMNAELLRLGARLQGPARTAPAYRLFVLELEPGRPGMVPSKNGVAVEGELWSVPVGALGHIVARLPEPQSLGPVRLEDGRTVSGFLCSHEASDLGVEISAFGGWRAYLDAMPGGGVA